MYILNCVLISLFCFNSCNTHMVSLLSDNVVHFLCILPERYLICKQINSSSFSLPFMQLVAYHTQVSEVSFFHLMLH